MTQAALPTQDADSSAPASHLPEDVVAMVPMRNAVLFPRVLMPIAVGREKSISAVLHAAQSRAQIGVVLHKNTQADEPTREELSDIGTLAAIVRVATTEDGQRHAVCQGVQRIRILELVEGHPFPAAQRAGLAKVMLPKRNDKDLRDVPASVRAVISFVLLETVDDAVRAALE